jgi:hypothetical protein
MNKIKIDNDTKLLLSLFLIGTGLSIIIAHYVKKKMLKDTYEYYKRENKENINI